MIMTIMMITIIVTMKIVIMIMTTMTVVIMTKTTTTTIDNLKGKHFFSAVGD